jgi:DNA-directed RNA polymerase II subunit RPB1
MTNRFNNILPIKDASTILGIQFSILSPDEIRKGSVAEITSPVPYENNKPKIGGLFDPRMGVLEPGLICPTDGLDYMQTPGYFGHIELARPVFYIQYLTTILKIMRCVCVKCSNILIDKEKYKQALNMSPEARWNYVFSIASKITRCGDNNDNVEGSNCGCGCEQPKRFKKEELATIYAEWENIEGMTEEEKANGGLIVKMTPEIVLKMFRRISDEDVHFMGFSPTFSRPDWMICSVLAVPPPAVRPSVKMDGNQRSEDDITHILVNILKANKMLQDKIKEEASPNVIDDWHQVLQYYVATQVDNKIPGAAAATQRSGRPLKSIKERLNGKGGRVRGNLMGKRVDFSARSVITPDPNLSIRELGVPLKIAKNITKPITVNKLNKNYLRKLVLNGPDVYPGAKILERKNGESISLRYADRESIELNDGDIVHRHMMNGDGILFNRQPTLHRMSMMCHLVKIMYKGDTFRMNVADTKPYNADFDGDEMNLHMPQDEESESELKNLAAVPYQIVSPANNSSIVGIFQDSLLGAFRFTRKDIEFNHLQAMNLLMAINKIDVEKLENKENISNFDVLSQIIPPITLKYGNKLFADSGEEFKDSNHIIDIKAGHYIRGQMDKSVLGGGKGLLQRICNFYGNKAGADFVDNLQDIITEYMKTSAYSVGISDLIANKETNEKIADTITDKKKDVKNIIDQTHLGIFENKTGRTNEEEFETRVTNILNKATSEAGKIGKQSLNKDNRFVIMVNAGSKGSEINISQMISCLGQQVVEGKRIPYGFENRTLPHYTKYDDSPGARGFIESSFISGLTPDELFFHAMGGRIGIIDTAVKTSQTGYIQRRLIKGMEDLKVEYDMTVRNNKQKIVQYLYGDDGIDTVRVENQILPLVSMSLEDIYAHFHMPMDDLKDAIFTTSYTKAAITKMKKQKTELDEKCKKYINYSIETRDKVVQNIFENRDNKQVHIPVAFTHVINNIQGIQNITKHSIVDITPLDAFIMIEKCMENMKKNIYYKPTELFEVMYYYYLSPKDLLMVKRFNKVALVSLLETIQLLYKQSLVAPGEMVGMIAAQSIGEPTTQMTLNTFHFAGVASKSNVSFGVPRIEEILSLSDNPKNPSITIYLKKEEEENKERAQELIPEIEHTPLREVVSGMEICFDPDDLNTLIEDDRDTLMQYYEFENMVKECMEEEGEEKVRSKWIIRLILDKEALLDKNITMDDVNFAINNSFQSDVSCVYSDYNSDKLVFRIRMNQIMSNKKQATKLNPLDQSDEIYILKNFQDNLLDNIILRGVKKIQKVVLRKITDSVYNDSGKYEKRESWVLDTKGTNLLDVLALDYIDTSRTYSNDIREIYRTFGIEAARKSIMNELSEVLEFDNTYINFHHLSLLCDRMTYSSNMISIFRNGINNDNIGPIAKASFEETPEQFLKAARHGELDLMRGVSANVMCGQEGYFGTNAFQIFGDVKEMSKMKTYDVEFEDEQKYIENAIGMEQDLANKCNVENLTLVNNANNIKQMDLGDDDDYDMGF